MVTQFSCFGGEHFGGCEVRAWERRGGLDVAETRQKGGHAGNSSNPKAGNRVQQTCTATCGVNRRSREERQGRKACCAWQRSAEGHPSFGRWRLGQDAGCLCRRRGVLWKTTREEVRTERWKGNSEEPHGPDRVFEDAVKDRGMRAGSLLTGGTLKTGRPRRSGVQRQGQGGMQEKPKDLHLSSANVEEGHTFGWVQHRQHP